MQEIFDAMTEARKQKKAQQERERMTYARDRLVALYWAVLPSPDSSSFSVESPTGKRFNFWPYTGYFAGPVRGRGLSNLIRLGSTR
jgi:hypothetical protein